MASSKDFLQFVLEQLSNLPEITYRAMMGEYVIYYHGRVIGGIYDNRLLVKLTPFSSYIPRIFTVVTVLLSSRFIPMDPTPTLFMQRVVWVRHTTKMDST